MNFRRVHIIVNPASGKDQPILHELNHVLHPAGIDWDIYVTKRGGDARRLAAEAAAAGADAVAVFGGDGTVAEVAAGLFGTQTPLVVLPGGTTNATARMLGIPVRFPEAAALLADPTAQVRVTDMLQVGDSYFFGVVAMGIPGEVAVQADRQAKDRYGNLAYAMAAVKATVHAPNSNYEIVLDGRKIETHGIMCIVVNQGAGLFRTKPPIDAADGLLDVAVFQDHSFLTLGRAVGNRRLREDIQPAEHYQGVEVTVRSTPEQAIQADGEVLPPGQVTVNILPAAVHFVVPGKKPA